MAFILQDTVGVVEAHLGILQKEENRLEVSKDIGMGRAVSRPEEIGE